MINNNFTLTQQGNGSLLSWTSASANLISFVSIDGGSIVTEYVPDSAERTLTIPLSKERTGKIEIHDLEPSEVFGGEIVAQPNTRPLLYWDDVESAVSYNIYNNDTLIGTMIIIAREQQYTMICPKVLERGWQSIRIEGVDEFGNESNRANWRYYILDLPDPKQITDVTGGSGVFDISIGAV